MVRPEVPCDPLLRQRARPVQRLRVPSVGRHGSPPHRHSIRSSPLYPLNTPEDPTGPQTESPRESREPTSPIRGPRPEGARRPTGPQTNSNPPHRIKPPRSQTIADLSRQRARWPKAPPQAASLPTTSASPSTPRVESRAAALQTGTRHLRCHDGRHHGSTAIRCVTPAQESHEARCRAGPLGACRGTPCGFGGFSTWSVPAASRIRGPLSRLLTCGHPRGMCTACTRPRSSLIAGTTGAGGRGGPRRHRTVPGPRRP
jgi:hypothetical protein